MNNFTKSKKIKDKYNDMFIQEVSNLNGVYDDKVDTLLEVLDFSIIYQYIQNGSNSYELLNILEKKIKTSLKETIVKIFNEDKNIKKISNGLSNAYNYLLSRGVVDNTTCCHSRCQITKKIAIDLYFKEMLEFFEDIKHKLTLVIYEFLKNLTLNLN